MKENKQKEKNPSFFGELGCFMKPYNGKYCLSVIISLLSVAAGIGAYVFAGKIAELLFSGNIKAESLILFTSLSVASKILHTLLLNFSTWISHRAAYGTLKDIRLAVSDKLLRMPLGYFETKGSGRIKTLLVDNIENMEKTLAHMLPELTANILGPVILGIWMFFIDRRLALACFIWIMLGFSVTGGMMKNYDEKFEGQKKALKNMNQAINEYVNGIEVIKNFGKADESYSKYKEAVYGHASYNVNWQKETQKYSALGMAIAPFSLFPVIITGLILYGKGSLEAGTLFLFIILTFGIFGPLMSSMNYFDALAGMGTNAKEIKEILDYPELKRGKTEKASGYDIIFSSVSYSYNKDGKKAADNISFTVPQGSMFALTGPSGSGKSTVAKLIAGYFDKDSGEILIGGQPIESYSGESLSSLISYVDQETFLFDESIMENIRKGRPSATDEEVIEAAKKAGCEDFIRQLPYGFDTEAGEAGNALSGGEKQRIAIARAILKDAPIIVLDEATASSDPENEALIQASLSEAVKGKTLIVVAHRLYTVKYADKIAFVENGKITAQGTHEEMLSSCRGYKNMWELSEVQNHA